MECSGIQWRAVEMGNKSENEAIKPTKPFIYINGSGPEKKKNCPKICFFSLIKINKNYNNFLLHLSSSYAKILGEKLFRTWEFLRSGSKTKDGGEKKKKRGERERLNDGNNNGQATHGAHKHAWGMQGAWTKMNSLSKVYFIISDIL